MKADGKTIWKMLTEAIFIGITIWGLFLLRDAIKVAADAVDCWKIEQQY